ncbi:hypothetical protein EVA_18264, partial [gut metagenome]
MLSSFTKLARADAWQELRSGLIVQGRVIKALMLRE